MDKLQIAENSGFDIWSLDDSNPVDSILLDHLSLN